MAYINGKKILDPTVILAKVDYSLVANSLKGTKSGENVIIDDISPLEHNIAVKVEGANSITRSGKNLIPYPYVDTTKTINGVTFTVNGDGTITADGTANAETEFSLARISGLLIEEGAEYIISGCPVGGGTYTYQVQIVQNNVYTTDIGSGKTFVGGTGDCRILIKIKSGVTVDNLVFKPQIELGTVVTEYEQYVEPITYPVNADGTVDGVKSAYPTTVLTADTEGATITAEYNKDINKCEFGEIPDLDDYYTKGEIDNMIGDIETLLGGI